MVHGVEPTYNAFESVFKVSYNIDEIDRSELSNVQLHDVEFKAYA